MCTIIGPQNGPFLLCWTDLEAFLNQLSYYKQLYNVGIQEDTGIYRESK